MVAAVVTAAAAVAAGDFKFNLMLTYCGCCLAVSATKRSPYFPNPDGEQQMSIVNVTFRVSNPPWADG
jgi:hypothetical protein